MRSTQKNWHRSQAMQLAILLPEEREDALEIIGCLRGIVNFLYEAPPPPEKPGATTGSPGLQGVFPFPGGSSSPRRRASSVGSASILPK